MYFDKPSEADNVRHFLRAQVIGYIRKHISEQMTFPQDKLFSEIGGLMCVTAKYL